MTSSAKTRAGAAHRRPRADILTGRLPRLAEQGLVVSRPWAGRRVMSPWAEDLRHLTDTRVVMETSVLRGSVKHGDLAWESGTIAAHHTLRRLPPMAGDGQLSEAWPAARSAFHGALPRGCPNQALRNIAESLRDSAEVCRCWSAGQVHDRDVAGEHARILDAVLSHDVEAATSASTEHIERTTPVLPRVRGRAENGLAPDGSREPSTAVDEVPARTPITDEVNPMNQPINVTRQGARRPVNMVGWLLQVVLAATFLFSAISKFMGVEEMRKTFEEIGVGQWLLYATGLVEAAGGIALLVPSLAALAALVLLCVMAGAVLTEALLVDDGNAVPALATLLLCAAVVWLRRAPALSRLNQLRARASS
ncbi:DoxX family protein [Streptomyces sp. GbtcB7]|uniref:DoxX family protein n=1 Tax=Streptomyces sp. GbtcB7 TaxID=2824752 RepID=UPI001C2FB603|nr:DoxX family protein [Streptomyces sp. GbtcB7]